MAWKKIVLDGSSPSFGTGTFTGDITMSKASPVLVLKQTDTSNNDIQMRNSSNTIVGRVKYDTVGGNHMYVTNRNSGNLVLGTNDTARLTINDTSATFGGDVTTGGIKKFSSQGSWSGEEPNR